LRDISGIVTRDHRGERPGRTREVGRQLRSFCDEARSLARVARTKHYAVRPVVGVRDIDSALTT
jgi:hypothetical protein